MRVPKPRCGEPRAERALLMLLRRNDRVELCSLHQLPTGAGEEPELGCCSLLLSDEFGVLSPTALYMDDEKLLVTDGHFTTHVRRFLHLLSMD